MKKLILMVISFILLFALIAFLIIPKERNLTGIGFLFPETLNDQTWGTEGYRGMLEVVQKYDTSFYKEENVNSRDEILRSVSYMADRDVNIIFGQGSEYEQTFNEIAPEYPDIHFVFLNGKTNHKNVTAIHMDGYAIGFFAGMTASKMSDTKVVGVIGAFKDQPEIKGYIDGAHYENKKTIVVGNYVETWGYSKYARSIAEMMIEKNRADVLFPAADGVNKDVMDVVQQRNKYAIGYISDQSYFGNYVLTSTVQDIAKIYNQLAEDYVKGSLKSGTVKEGIPEDVERLGKFSSDVTESYKKKIATLYLQYKETGKLPNE